jgi:hypothetical protein
MSIAQEIRTAALGPRPHGTHPNAAMWIKSQSYWTVLNFITHSDGRFFRADEDTQRTFLLLVACALED